MTASWPRKRPRRRRGFGDATRLQADEDFAAARRAPSFAALQRRLANDRVIVTGTGSAAG